MQNYYVYQYVREDGTPYYIGKGSKRRAWEGHKRANGSDLRPKDRSRIQVIEKHLTEHEAWNLEKELIAKHKRIVDGGILVNCNLGGEGGQTVSSESRMGKNNPRWGVKEDPATTELRIQRMLVTKNLPNYDLYKKAIALMDNGKSADVVSKELGVGRGVCFKLKNRTHGFFQAFPELI
jgi:hypothetical protein